MSNVRLRTGEKMNKSDQYNYDVFKRLSNVKSGDDGISEKVNAAADIMI